MVAIIISMDMSAGEERIRWALRDVDGIDDVDVDVQVYEDNNRVVVTGRADVDEVVEKLTRRLRIEYEDLTIVSYQEPKLELSSDEEGDEEEEEEGSSSSEEGYGMCFPAARIDEPSSEDQPVPDPSLWFFNFSFADNPPQDDDDEGKKRVGRSSGMH